MPILTFENDAIKRELTSEFGKPWTDRVIPPGVFAPPTKDEISARILQQRVENGAWLVRNCGTSKSAEDVAKQFGVEIGLAKLIWNDAAQQFASQSIASNIMGLVETMVRMEYAMQKRAGRVWRRDRTVLES